MRRHNVEKFKELRLCTAPATLVRRVVGIQVGLIPDLPIAEIETITVCPALGIVSDDMLADLCPFLKILRHNRTVFLNLMLNTRTETVEGLRSGRFGGQNIIICAEEIVGCRIVNVRLKSRENGVNVDGMLVAVVGVEGRIMIACKGNARRHIFHHVASSTPGIRIGGLGNRTIVNGMHRLDRADRTVKIHLDLCHNHNSFSTLLFQIACISRNHRFSFSIQQNGQAATVAA